MNICRWCGGRTQATGFCSPQCAGAAAELPDLVDRSSDPTAHMPRKVAAPRRPWALGVLAGALLGVAGTMAFIANGSEPTPKTNRCEVARARAQVKAATLDFLENGLAGIWDGRVSDSTGLSPWFVAGTTAESHTGRIFADQSRRLGARMVSAEVIDVRLAPTLDHADADFFVKTAEPRGERCYVGTFTWLSQDNGTWLRARASHLRDTTCQ